MALKAQVDVELQFSEDELFVARWTRFVKSVLCCCTARSRRGDLFHLEMTLDAYTSPLNLNPSNSDHLWSAMEFKVVLERTGETDCFGMEALLRVEGWWAFVCGEVTDVVVVSR